MGRKRSKGDVVSGHPNLMSDATIVDPWAALDCVPVRLRLRHTARDAGPVVKEMEGMEGMGMLHPPGYLRRQHQTYQTV